MSAGPGSGNGASVASLAGGVLALAGLIAIGLQLRGLASGLDDLEDRIGKLPPSVAGAGAEGETKPVLTAEEVARLAAEVTALRGMAGKVQSEVDGRIMIDPTAEVPARDPKALAKFASDYIEIHDRVEREKFAKERLQRCVGLAQDTYLKITLAKNLKLDLDQQKKISAILDEELSRSLEYLSRKEHPSDEATALKNSILNAADERIRGVLNPDQLKLYPKHKTDWIGGMLHIAGER